MESKPRGQAGMSFRVMSDNEYPNNIPQLRTEMETKAHNIIWDLSTQLGEAKHKIKMLEWKLNEMKKIINE